MKINWIFFAGSLALFSASVVEAQAASPAAQQRETMETMKIALNERKTVKRDVRSERRDARQDHRRDDRRARRDDHKDRRQQHRQDHRQDHRQQRRDGKHATREHRLNERQAYRDSKHHDSKHRGGKHDGKHGVKHGAKHHNHRSTGHHGHGKHHSDRWARHYHGHKKYHTNYWRTGHHRHTRYCGHGHHFDDDFAYLASGLILGGIIHQTFFDGGYTYYGSNRWGECFKVSIHHGRESYTEVPRYMCY